MIDAGHGTGKAEMIFLAISAGIAIGATIVFVGVWMVMSWDVAGRTIRCIMSIVLAVALVAAARSFLKVFPAELLAGFGGALATFAACSVLLGGYRVWRETWAHRPETWGAWLLRQIGGVLFLPLTIVVVLASAASTIALFTAMHEGPQAGPAIFELSIVTATGWAMVTVGRVWAHRRSQKRVWRSLSQSAGRERL